ncbi:cellulose binding domain-containing protein [Micromonospora sp. M12]
MTNGWNATVSQSGSTVTARNASYNGSIPAGGSTEFGVQGTFGPSGGAPTGFSLNGVPCNGAGPTTRHPRLRRPPRLHPRPAAHDPPPPRRRRPGAPEPCSVTASRTRPARRHPVTGPW